MKNKDIITLCNGGFLAATGHCLPVEHYYKFYKFKRAVANANRAIGTAQADLLHDCGIDPTKFGEAPAEALERFNTANNALRDEDSGVEVSCRIPAEFYKKLYDENVKDGRDIFADVEVEAIVIDNLFIENMEEPNDEK